MILRAVFIFVGLVLSGCNASPQSLTSLEPNARALGCFYHDPADPNFGQKFLVDEQNFVWAKDDAGKYVQLRGYSQDGFYVVDSVEGSTANSHDKMEELCKKSIETATGKTTLKLYRVDAISAYGASIGLPIEDFLHPNRRLPPVFADENQPGKISRMIIFGDSLSDNGNVQRAYSGTGVFSFPAPPYFLGRFTNGLVWNDVIRTQANIAVQNHAYGGSTTGRWDDSSTILGEVIYEGRATITGDLELYIDRYIGETLKNAPAQAPEKTLVVVWCGANDFFTVWQIPGGLDKMVDETSGEGSGPAIAQRAVQQIMTQVQKLADKGFTNIAVINLPNLGIAPTVATDTKYHADDSSLTPEQRRAQLQTRIEAIFNGFNDDLRDRVSKTNWKYIDAYSEINKMLTASGPQGGNLYGVDTTTNRVDLGNDAFGFKHCYEGTFLGSSNAADVCPTVARAPFFDDVHPTAYVHCWLGYVLHEQLHSAAPLPKTADLDQYKRYCGLTS